MISTKKIIESLNSEAIKARSAWKRGVCAYALDLVESFDDWQQWHDVESWPNGRDLRDILLNGADDWRSYSFGGSSLIYNEDIALRLCNPSELKRTRNGEREPNGRETWLHVQARALYQAYLLISKKIQGGEA